ncbi:MAG: hypothetical protein HY314_14260 [Acidobacteria bacterium]|nr:hypothetical protein [Acidobacteriota bacterium]
MRKVITGLLVIIALFQCSVAMAQGNLPPQTSELEERLKRLEAKLDEALKLLERTQAQVESLTAEVTELRAQLSDGRSAAAVPAQPETAKAPSTTPSPGRSEPEAARSAFTERILGVGLGEDERQNELSLRPEIFIQTRYSTLPHKGATIEDIESNFRLSRIETRWSGHINERFGLGLEIQYHPAPDGSPEELVNDAFMEYYLSDHATLRVGQLVKPFGFDIQQSSSVRESPERAIFAGYFFPGQRDRGALLFGDLDFLNTPALKHVQYFAAVLNGNRFFTDSNRQLNYLFRLRKQFEAINLAAGVSVQLGHQLLPPGFSGNNHENVFGVDVQYAWGRFGLRGELVAGNRPSTRLGLEPGFAPAFRPGRHSSGGAVFATYQLTEKDNIYARYDQFNGDPVTGQNVRAFNFGYFRWLGESARIGLDYQFKNRLSFNDDAVNTKLQVTWGMTF